ncbi:arsenic resistance N-acetyltransferase ArsN2 [Paraburkholderia sp. ZP32-5]|uniref:arsenic resistance N-acetyltransferase ArsN2 n=1 Tax=Paraburkholderia sp. ZP32-5 TaxID=2883245 RepID=UPI001F3A9AE3|nr:arsenic resistance N-acetyltransferase ArsN2 [Paraburkholderia sp. ZP32-5]
MNQATFTIRRADGNDLDRITALLATCELPTADVTLTLLHAFLVAVDRDGAISGSIGLQALKNDALLRSLAVAPHARRAGIGNALLAAIEARARADAHANLWLLTTDAQHFFERQGYRTVNRNIVPDDVRATEQFTRLCPATAVCMMKRLS